MFLDKSDPTGIGLFSRCGRNQASKNMVNRPRSSHPRNSKVPFQVINRERALSSSWFDKQESRQQREKKFRKEDTPAVGQYNPVKPTRPKMVWDILKAHNTKKKFATKSFTKEPVNKIVKAETEKQIEDQDQNFKEQESRIDAFSKSKVQNVKTENSNLSKSQCIVNMSRQTGRRQIHDLQSSQHKGLDVSASSKITKQKMVKNIYFNKQLQREIYKTATMTPGHSYNLNYDMIKPKKKGTIRIGLLKGRQQRQSRQADSHGYLHYEYDSYVWQSSSRVFPNTKTHLIGFDKQSSRYGKASLRGQHSELSP